MKAYTLLPTITLLSMSFISACEIANANGFGGGIITYLGGQSSAAPGVSLVYFGISPAPTGKPACSNNEFYQFAFDANTPDGKSLYAALLSAQAQGRAITVYGTGSCVLGRYRLQT